MNLSQVDLNLLVYLDALLRERNVTRAAQKLSMSQPALSSGLKRLRDLFSDPLLIRTSEGMVPTERALELEPQLREILTNIEKAVEPSTDFDAKTSKRVFRIMASDYAELTLMPRLLSHLRNNAPRVILDILTPSDVTFRDVELGKVDMVINRFDDMPMSFHQGTVWKDDFSCVLLASNPIADNFTLDNYLSGKHVWVSKTGMGVGVGVNPLDVAKLGWVDQELAKHGYKRNIRVFTRHYHAAIHLALEEDLIATVPSMALKNLYTKKAFRILPPPFSIAEMELKIAWSPLLQHNSGHKWMRRLIQDIAKELIIAGQSQPKR